MLLIYSPAGKSTYRALCIFFMHVCKHTQADDELSIHPQMVSPSEFTLPFRSPASQPSLGVAVPIFCN